MSPAVIKYTTAVGSRQSAVGICQHMHFVKESTTEAHKYIQMLITPGPHGEAGGDLAPAAAIWLA